MRLCKDDLCLLPHVLPKTAQTPFRKPNRKATLPLNHRAPFHIQTELQHRSCTVRAVMGQACITAAPVPPPTPPLANKRSAVAAAASASRQSNGGSGKSAGAGLRVEPTPYTEVDGVRLSGVIIHCHSDCSAKENPAFTLFNDTPWPLVASVASGKQ